MSKLPKKPASLEQLAKALTKAWAQYGVVSVGTAWGLTGDNSPSWKIFAYTRDPDNVGRQLPVYVESDDTRYPVEVKAVPRALDVNEN